MLHKRSAVFAALLTAIALWVSGVGTGCKSNSANKSGKRKTDIPPDVAAAFWEDAARLAVRDINTTKTGTGELEGTIPQAMIEKYYDQLANCYRLAKTIDSLPDLGQIHTINRPDLHRINLVLELNAPFRANWQAGSTLSNDLYLNQIIGKYQLKIAEYKEGGLGPMVTLESPNLINTTEVAFLLSHITGIKSAEAAGVAGDGNNIEAGAEGKNATAIRFSLGRGDCPSGCIHRKYWVFYVNPDNTVQFVGTRGSIPNE